MTDLEQHWDDLPVGPAPVDAILREARRQAAAEARRRPEARLKRSLVGVTAFGGIAAAFVAGTLVSTSGGPGGPAADDPPYGAGGTDLAPAAFHGELQAPASCDDLLAHYRERGVDRVGEWGWGGPYGYRVLEEGFAEMPMADAELSGAIPRGGFTTQRFSAPSPASGLATTTRAESSGTGTNVQEVGVDEPDVVKTDGRVLVRLRDARLTTYDVSGRVADGVTELGSLDLGDFHDGEILLAGDTVVALGNDGTASQARDPYTGSPLPSPQTRVLTVDLSDPAAPSVRQSIDYDAMLVAARQHGTDVRLVLSKGLPDLDFVDPDHDTEEPSGDEAERTNRTVVEESTLDDWLPQVTVDGGEPQDLLACDRVAIPRAELGLATMAVVGFGADSPDELDSLGLAGEAPMTYESTDHLYLAATPAGNDFFDCWECVRRPTSTGDTGTGTTHVYDFELDGTGASYVGAGEVEGHVRDRWSMDEAGGVLRLAVGPSSETGNYNSVVTMRAEGDELVEIGRVDDIGVGEDIKSVRWFDDLAILVTFRQVDPLYTIDLTDDADPRLLGELKIPGFSSYLHPLGTKRLLGIGSDGRGGAQAGLFAVADLTDPRQLDVAAYGRGFHARAGDDPRQFTWLQDRRTALTVLTRGRTVYLSQVRVVDGGLEESREEVEFGADVEVVRAVPLPGGKVALVTGEDVEYVDVS
jgi:hypothetical protein